jgi:GDP-mannose 6-dehydrogenase
MRVSVFGLGYVGSVTAACVADAGHYVVGVDVNPEKVAIVNAGDPPVVEPGLGELLARVVKSGRLKATTSTTGAVRDTDLALICVGTPSGANGELDVSFIRRVGEEIGSALGGSQRPYTVVLRSTVLPGTTEQVLLSALHAGSVREPGSRFRVAVNPEFMREGSSLRDFQAPPLTLVGCADEETPELLRALYSRVDAPFVSTTIRTAEMVKYVGNAFHAVKVCFANEIADLCTSLEVGAQDVMRIFRMDRTLNISDSYLRPGFAFGGSCLPKDLRALLYAARRADMMLPLLSSVIPSNEGQVRRAVDAVLQTRKRRIGVVGLAFKSGTDDLRESPLVSLIETLIGKGLDVRILDGHVSLARLVGANRRYIEEEIPHISSLMCDSAEALLAHADVLVIGNAGKEAELVLAGCRPNQVVIDLTRGGFALRQADDRSQ